jgi:hypothetical protein
VKIRSKPKDIENIPKHNTVNHNNVATKDWDCSIITNSYLLSFMLITIVEEKMLVFRHMSSILKSTIHSCEEVEDHKAKCRTTCAKLEVQTLPSKTLLLLAVCLAISSIF